MLDDFQEEDVEEEREREVADFYALQRSRRVFGAKRLGESSELDDEESNGSISGSKSADARLLEERGRGRGIKSSWNGGLQGNKQRGDAPETVGEEEEDSTSKGGLDDRPHSESSSKGKGKLLDVALDSTVDDSEPPEDLVNAALEESTPPSFHQFGNVPKSGFLGDAKHSNIRADLESGVSGTESIRSTPRAVPVVSGEPPKHDVFWGSLYLICTASLFATFFLVFLHTSAPSGGNPLGDTIYTTLHSSFHLLAVDTLVAVIVSMIWLALLRSFVRPLVHLILIAVPVIMTSFFFYPLVSSYKGPDHGSSLQDRVMRWFSFAPAIFAVIWVYTVYKGRHSLNKAIGILEFSCRILAASPGLLLIGFAMLAAVIVWTWLWLGMFTRVFLGGHLSSTRSLFIIDATTWWLGVFFVLMYMWTISVMTGIQRATTAATVSQWYFHRNATPAPSSNEVVVAAVTHATTTLFGTVCLHGFLTLLIRLPLLVLPKRVLGIVSIFAYSFIPTPIAALTNPLTLTYAAIHSQPLNESGRGLSHMTFLAPQAPTTTLTPRSFASRTHSASPLLPYRLAKLLLYATRFIMAMALGFGAWVSTARQLQIKLPGGVGVRGSAYAYVIGIVASFIGWGVLGAMEGILSGIVDASVICWGSEKSMVGGGHYCIEAGNLFGEVREEVDY